MDPVRPYPGLFVVLEGADGTGKSTLARTLLDTLSKHRIPCHMTREPGGNPFAEKIRDILLSPDLTVDPMVQALLFNASRRENVEQVIKPRLMKGEVVICDRFLLSTLAYQGPDIGYDKVVNLHREAIGLVPDLMFLVDADTGAIHQRINVRPDEDPAGINEWTSPEKIKARRDLYKRAMHEMQASLGPQSFNGGQGWMTVDNNLPLHVAEGEMMVHVLRSIVDLLPSNPFRNQEKGALA